MNIPIQNGQLTYFPDFLTAPAQLRYFELLSQTLAWKQDEINIFGKRVPIPRLQAWYGDSETEYSYSGIQMQPNPWTDELLQLKEHVELTSNCHFNSMLANFYRDGMDKVGYHADDEPELGEQPVIASLSLGCTRKFTLKHNQTDEKVSIDLVGGSLLILASDTQQYYKHALMQQKKAVGGRINLTFRYTCPVGL